VIGEVDDRNRALIDLEVRRTPNDPTNGTIQPAAAKGHDFRTDPIRRL
jgi:hypothetical protein